MEKVDVEVEELPARSVASTVSEKVPMLDVDIAAPLRSEELQLMIPEIESVQL